MWIAITIGAIIALIILISAICFLKVFYSGSRKPLKNDKYEIPPGKIYKEFRDEMIGWMKTARKITHKEFEIKSYDGLTLRGRYYEYSNSAPIELLFHGYRGNAERDMSGGIERCFAMGRSALIIDQRACGTSDGHVITFGIRECRDCLSWIDFVNDHFGPETKIILTGISMGAATVLMAAGSEDLPSNVVCVLADCGYTSAKDIIVTRLKRVPFLVPVVYPFVKLGALIFGGFNLEGNSPIKAMHKSSVPVIFIHGDKDKFVPCEMSTALYEACSSRHKKLTVIPEAGHGLAYPRDKEKYISTLNDFQKECGF